MKGYSDISQDLYERIESYLSGGMDVSKRALFEGEMQQDAALRKEVELQRDLISAVELGAIEETLHDIEKEWQTPGGENAPESRRYWYAMAASFLALVALGVWMLTKPSTQEKLFAEYVAYDPGLPVPMSTTAEYQFYDAMVDYKNEKYSLAIEKWTKLLEENPTSDTLNYFLGSALFQKQEYSAAVPYFDQVANQDSHAFAAKSQFYLVLSWLQTGDFDRIDSMSNKVLPPYRSEIRKIDEALSEE